MRARFMISLAAIAVLSMPILAQDGGLGQRRDRNGGSGTQGSGTGSGSSSGQRRDTPPIDRAPKPKNDGNQGNPGPNRDRNRLPLPPVRDPNADKGKSGDRNRLPLPPARDPRQGGPGQGDGSLGTGNRRGTDPGSGRQDDNTKGTDRNRLPMPPVRDPRIGGNGQTDGSLGSSTRRGNDSRSGRVDYGGQNNNLRGKSGDTGAVQIDRIPVNRGIGDLAGQVLREERTLPNYRYRNGYYHYDSNWFDSSWCYPFYTFSYSNRCAFSPWYYYSFLPGYIRYDRCSWDLPYVEIRVSNFYNWTPRNYYDRYSDTYELDCTVSDLVRTWERRDERALDRLIPRRGSVWVTIEDGYRYALNSSDFFDLMQDAIDSARTQDYRIIEVRTGRNGARVIAEHRYGDPWGRSRSIYHTYWLSGNNRGYEIEEFRSSLDCPRY